MPVHSFINFLFPLVSIIEVKQRKLKNIFSAKLRFLKNNDDLNLARGIT